MSVLDIPKDIIKQHIIPHLYGRDVQYFLTSHPRFYGMHDSIQRMVLAFGQRNVYRVAPRIKPPHNIRKKDQDKIPCIYCKHEIYEYGYENHTSRCPMNPNIQGKIRCKSGDEFHHYMCPLVTYICKICSTRGCVGDIAPWRYNKKSDVKCLLCNKNNDNIVGCVQCKEFRCPYKISHCCKQDISCIPNHQCCKYCKEDITGIPNHQCTRSIPRWQQMLSSINSNHFVKLGYNTYRVEVSKPHRYYQLTSSLTGMMYHIVWVPINAIDAKNPNMIKYIMDTQHSSDVVFIVKGEATDVSDISCVLYFNLGCMADSKTEGWFKV